MRFCVWVCSWVAKHVLVSHFRTNVWIPANRSQPWPFLLFYVHHICARQRLGPSAPCQPSTSFYRPSHERCAPPALIRCYIRMVFLGSKWIWFHYTLTNGPSNNFKLAERVPSHSPWRYLSVIKNRGKCVALEDTQHIKEVIFWNEGRVQAERIWSVKTKCVCSTCLENTPEICPGTCKKTLSDNLKFECPSLASSCYWCFPNGA